MLSEFKLDLAFASKIESSHSFCRWVLDQTKFKELSNEAILLREEQIALKPKKKPENWWRHWWCRLDDGTESETDIFLVFGFPNSDKRIALHIEDKLSYGEFTPNQYINYDRRAQFMANKKEFMNYSGYTTILLAPEKFFADNVRRINHFECHISYESVAEVIPEFAQSLAEARNESN
ncbi:MAG TPA: hypothetical protein DHV36_21070 [Desulfobacteraceae bacterium]|nr:hypothetical protein [Desulfobacteraceae bacterium]